MHVGDVDLDERDIHTRQRISQRDARVGEGTGIDDNRVDFVDPRLMDTVNEGAFVVGLETRDGDWFVGCGEGRAAVLEHGLYVGEGFAAVEMWLSGSEEVEVWAVEEKD